MIGVARSTMAALDRRAPSDRSNRTSSKFPGYAANPLNRCYLCKHNLFTVCEAKARELGIDEIVDGLNLDDLHDYRPGMQAAARKARAPSAGRSAN